MKIGIGIGIGVPRPAGVAVSLADELSVLLAPASEFLLIFPIKKKFLTQDRAGTIPVTSDGQMVGRIQDAGLSGLHLTATSDGARGVFRQVGRYQWIEFNGINTIYATVVLPSMSSNTAQAFIAARKTLDNSRRLLVEGSGARGIFGLEAPTTFSGTFAFGHQGESGFRQTQIAAGHSSPVNAVLTGLSNLSSPSVALRVNGIATGNPVTTATGGGKYNPALSSPLFLGGRHGGTLLFSGSVYGALAVRFSMSDLDISTVVAVETLLAAEITGSP